MKSHNPGYPGHDAMRENAERLFKDEPLNREAYTRSASAPDREKIRPYKKGGHVEHKITEMQKDMKLPTRKKMPKLVRRNFEKSEHMKKGGHVKNMAFGGMTYGPLGINTKGIASGESRMTPAVMPRPGLNPNMKKGGDMRKKAGGGSIYENRMVGEKPSRGAPHINYESDMKGEHPVRGTKMAAGGVAKMRHKEMTKSGKQMAPRRLSKNPAYC